MKIQSNLKVSIASSLLISAVIACIAFFILQSMKLELERSRLYDETITKTNAMNVLLASLKENSNASDLTQMLHVQASLEGLLGTLASKRVPEEPLVRVIRTENDELGLLLAQVPSQGMRMREDEEKERREILDSQLWMKVRHISDEACRLRDMSRGRTQAAQADAGITVFALLVVLILSNTVISALSGRNVLMADMALRGQREWLRVTLASIGDAVLTTDTEGKVTFLNPVAAELTGTAPEQAVGRPLHTVFRIINEKTRIPAEDIVAKVLREGRIVPLANHTALIAGDGREIPIEDSAAPIKDADGSIEGVVLVFHDVTEKRRSQDALAENENRFRLFMDNSPTTACVKDEQGRYVYLSKTFEKRFGVRMEEWRGKTDAELWPEAVAGEFHRSDRAVLASDHAMQLLEETVDPNGRRCFWLNSKFPFRDAAGNRFVAVIGMDVTERRKMEDESAKLAEEIDMQRARLQAILDSLPVGVWITDAAGKMLVVNDFAQEIWGGNAPVPEDIEGYHVYKAWSADTDEPVSPRDMPLARAIGGETIKERVLRFERFDGNRGTQVVSAAPVKDRTGRIAGGVAIAQDVTRLTQTENSLRESLKEKVALLKEVHHRVKNNLQIVASLLTLQARRSKNPLVADVLLDTRNRVKSMALLHETLYSSGNLAHINFAIYLKDLCGQIQVSFGPVADRVRLEYAVEPIGLPLEQAVPCGLIVSELVSNALKHGFPGKRTGRILVEFDLSEEKNLVLSVRDNGTGLPTDFDPTETVTLGMQLVSRLSRQLGGALEIHAAGKTGAAFRVVFPAPEDIRIEERL